MTEVGEEGEAQVRRDDLAAAALAGLLHDIGALWFRTGEHIPPEVVSAGRNSTPATVHAHWSAAFAARHALVGCQDDVVAAVRDHHEPQNRLGNIIALAALLAAGGNGPSPDGGSTQLRSALASLHRSEVTGQASNEAATRDRVRRYFVPLHPLAPNRAALFPTTVRLSGREAAAAHARLWHGLLDEHALIPMTNDLAYADSLWWLLRKYTWCSPSIAAGQSRDTSLFDHLRLTAAIAVSLVLNGTTDGEVAGLLADLAGPDVKEAAESKPAWHTPRLTLVAVQVSERDWPAGRPHNTNVDIARATSFSLSVLRRGAVQWLRERWTLPQANVLFEGGGTAYLLAPTQVLVGVDGTQEELERCLWQAGGWRGKVGLAAQPLTVGDLCPPAAGFGESTGGDQHRHLGTVWRALGQELAWRCSRPGGAANAEDLAAQLFTAQGRGGGAGTCSLCHAELAARAQVSGRDNVCDRCSSLRELGRELRRPGYLVLSHSQPPAGMPAPAPLPGLVAPLPTGAEPVADPVSDTLVQAEREQPPAVGWQAALEALGLRVSVLPATDDSPDRQAERLLHALPPRGPATVLRLNDTSGGWAELQQLARTDRPLVVGWQLLTDGHELPGGRVDTRSLGRRARGVRTVAFLRTDIDDVLAHLAEGVGKGSIPGRVLTVSAMLSVFSELWLPAVLTGSGVSDSAAERRRSRVCGIAAGGDGAGAVGAWNAIVELAQQLARDIGQYGCRNEAVHLSAGIVTAQPRMSVLTGDDAALAALAKAKGRRKVAVADARGLTKNGVCFLGQTLGWPAFSVASRYSRTLLQPRRASGRSSRSGSGLVPALLTAFTRLRAAASLWHVDGGEPGNGGPSDGGGSQQDGRVPSGSWTWYAAQELAIAARDLPTEEARRVLGFRELLHSPKEAGLPALMAATAWAAMLSGMDARPQEVSW